MPLYSYKAVDAQNQLTEGVSSGKNEEEIADFLQKKSLRPITIKQVQQLMHHGGKLPAIEKITFCRYMSAMLSSGLSLSKGIEVLQEETKNPLMRKILSDVVYGLDHGYQLSVIFAQYPDVFDHFFLTLVEVGEMSGTLADVFVYLEQGLRSEMTLQQKIKGALLYPAVVFCAMGGIGFLMFFFVLPQIGKVFLNMKLPIPAATKALFTFSILLSNNIIPILISMIVSIVVFILILKSKRGRDMLLLLISPLPIIRTLMQRIDLARFTRIFSTLLFSAVPAIQALDIAVTSFSWYGFRKIANNLKTNVVKGVSFADSFREQHVFPSLLIQMIAAGEKTGTLEKTLSDLATFYEEKVEDEVKNVTQILEPMLILLVGVAVGAMVLSIIAPIYSVVNTLQGQIGR